MEDHSFLYAAFAIFSLLTLSTIVLSITKLIRIPFAVGLLFAGIGLSLLQHAYDLEVLNYFSFSPDVVFYVFLPTLIFEAAYHLNLHQFKGLFREILSLAFLGLLVSTGVIGVGLNYLLDMPITIALVFGALISATDPVAVLAIFKELKAPKKLTTIVDGESLMNDAIALVFFQFFLKIAGGAAFVFSAKFIFTETAHLVQSLMLGVIVGAILGFVFSFAIAKIESKGAQLTLSLILAHATFLVAEGILTHILHIPTSGILATMVAGLIMGNFGKRKLSQPTVKSFAEIWDFLGFLSNALIFILLGVKIGQIDFNLYWKEILVASALTLFVARGVSVFVSLGLSNLTRAKNQEISFSYKIITMWGGLRGALAATAVLMIPAKNEYVEMLQAMTAGVILVSFLINAMTITALLKKLKIVNFTKNENLQEKEAQIIIDEEVLVYLDWLFDKKYIPEFAYQELKDKYEGYLKNSNKEFKKMNDNFSENEREVEFLLTHYALGVELQTYRKLYIRKEIGENRFVSFKSSIHRQLDRLERGELPDEREMKKFKVAPVIPNKCHFCKNIKISGFRKVATKFFNYFRNKTILDQLMHYRGRRIASWKVVEEFKKLENDHPIFKNSKVVKKIMRRYLKWNKNAEKKMHQLENKFPEILRGVRLRLAEESCLKKEAEVEREYFEKGFICEKVFDHLEESVRQRRKICQNNFN